MGRIEARHAITVPTDVATALVTGDDASLSVGGSIDTDGLPVWMTCLGCFATREPGDATNDCACTYGATDDPACSVLDFDHVEEWVDSATTGDATPDRTGHFPLRVAIVEAGDDRHDRVVGSVDLVCQDTNCDGTSRVTVSRPKPIRTPIVVLPREGTGVGVWKLTHREAAAVRNLTW